MRGRAEYLAAPEYRQDAFIQEDRTYFDSLADDISTKGGMSNESRKGSVSRSHAVRNQQSDISQSDDKK